MLGCNDQAAIDHNLKQVNSHQPLLDALTHPKMPPQVATGLLRVCASNKFNYLARLHPPRHTLQAALLFDERRIEAFNKICDISPPLPRNFTNNYIFDSVLCFRLAINTIVPAFFAASVVAAHSDPSLFEHSSDNMPPHIQHFQHAWQTLINFGLPADTQPPVNANGIPTRNALATLPQDFNSIPEFYHPSLSADDPAKIQRSLSKALSAQRREYVLEISDNATVARLNSLQSEGAMAWFFSTPCSPLTTFTAREWKEAVKFITNSPLDASLSTCICGHDLSANNSPINHFNVCHKFRKTFINNRHNSVCHATTSQANSVGIVAVSEYNHQGLERTRPDGIQYFDERPNQSDVTIRQPDATSYLRYARSPGKLLDIAEKAKHKKYDGQATAEGASFRALALEAYGALGKEFLEHIKKLVKHAADHNSFLALSTSPTALKQRFIAEISAALMKGNANIRLKATQQCLAYAKRSPNQAHHSSKTNQAHQSLSNKSFYLSSFSPCYARPTLPSSSSPPPSLLSPSLFR